ncbi:MAG: protein kinase [Pirellulales bacterium]
MMSDPNPSIDTKNSSNPQTSKVEWWFASALGKQEWFWHKGSPVSIESIINSAPNPLSNDQQLSLICNEVYLRETAGQKPTLEEYQQRFTHLAKALEIQWQIDHMLCPVQGESTVVDSQVHHSPTHAVTGQLIADRYEVVKQIGSGGMGTVYEAIDTRLRRTVALKILNRASREVDSIASRFRREAKLIASLDSPHVVAIYDTGESDSGPYIAMQYCEAGTLSDLLRQGMLSTRLAADLVRQAALGIDAAHSVGVVHRDLKPGNLLLVNNAGSKNPEGQLEVRVADFGLARQIEDDCTQTQTGDLLGTPAYLAPEQLLGKKSTSLAPMDIYALGAILYECLTGRPPIRGETAMETLRLLAKQEPVAIRSLQPNVPVDLATIAHKCLQREPKDRYENAKQVAEDLQRFLQGQPIAARPISGFARLVKWSRRNPLVAGLVGGVISSLSLGLIATSYMYRVANQNAIAAKENEQVANLNEQAAISNSKVAQRNSELAAGAINEYLTEIAENEELKQSGLELLRRKLLEKAQTYYSDLVQQPTQDFDQLRDLADVYHRLAEICNELGQTETANKHYGEMIKILEKLAEDHTDDNLRDELLRSIALGKKERAMVVFQIGDTKASEVLFQRSIDLLRQLRSRTDSVPDKIQLAWTLSDYALQITSADRGEEKRMVFDEVAKLCKQIDSSQEMYSPKVADQLISAFDRLALDWQSRSQLEESIECFKRVCQLSQSQLETRPGNTTLIRSLARGHKGLQMAYARQQKPDDATREFEAADQALQSLCQQHPLVIQYLDDHTTIIFNQATILARVGKIAEAVALFLRAIDSQKQIIRMDPKSFEANNAMVLFCANTANVLSKTGELDRAEQVVKDGLAAADVARTMKPDDNSLTYFFAALQNTKAAVNRSQGKLTDSIESFDQAADSAIKLWEKDKSRIDIAILGATARKNGSIVKRQLKQNAQAKSSAEMGYSTAAEISKLAPTLLEGSILVTDFSLLLGELEFDENNLARASELAKTSFDRYQNFHSTAQSPQGFISGLGDSCNLLGRCALANNDLLAANEWFDKALEYHTRDLELKEKAGAVSEVKRISNVLEKTTLNKAVVLVKQQQYELAKDLLKRIDESKEEHKSTLAELKEQISAAGK